MLRKRKPASRATRGASSRRGRGGSRTRASSRGRATSRSRRRGIRLEQRHLDLIGLGLIAAGVYLWGVWFLGWDGGRVGSAADTAMAYVAGAVAGVLPLVLAGIGVALLLRPFIPAPGALNAGAVCLLAGLLLAYASQTAGLGPDQPHRHGFFEPDFFSDHGGAVGETLYWAAATLFQRPGAHILAILLVAAGLLLLSGSTFSALAGRGAAALRRAGSAGRDLARAALPTREHPDEALVLTEANDTEPFATELLGPDGEDGHEVETVAGAAGDGARPGSPPALSFDETVNLPTDGDDAVDSADGPPGPPSEEIAVARTPMAERRSGVTESDELSYTVPPAKLLHKGGPDQAPDTRGREAVGRALIETLASFGVDAEIVGTVIGPHVSRYELRLAPGTKVSKVTQLKDDLAYALASTDIRILAPIPGKQAIGVEVPNQRRKLVRLGDIYQGRPSGSSPLVGWLGKDIAGHAVWTDLAKMPHVLVAGTTGSGKSGCINAILSSLLLHASPNELRLVLVDPKQVELNHYEQIPHLLTPVVTAPRLAANVLSNLIVEMESRYGVMGQARARNLAELNRIRRRAGHPPLPHILCVIDELADLMMVAPAEVEDSVIRLAQKSRAVGIHLVLATQRPSTDVITGTIKVNIPARIAFAVASQVDSRVILDQGGAETLLGQGDMLFRPAGTSKLQRIQGAFVTEEEIAKITKHWSRQGEPEFAEELLEARIEPEDEADGELSPDQDDLLADAVRLVVQTQTASVSMVQRRMRVGYTRAGRLIDMLERRGVISGYEGSKPRQVLISEAELSRVLERLDGTGAGAAEGDELEPVGEAAGPPPASD
ncbi:MAG TPA: DNA translocase FtsK [Solirubrobacterales bacterium]|nr:DNA translocase FtsK [Solirubrobacterales bacterium]